MLGMKEHVIFSKERIGFDQMNALYNMSDTLIMRACNEGFGLPALEMMMAGRPIIALKTGGLTRQIENHETGEQYGIAMDPDVRTMVGNQMVPYIYEDFVSHETVSRAFMKMYEMGPDKRDKLGKRACQHALKDYNALDLIDAWDRSLSKLTVEWKRGQNRWKVMEI